MSRTLIIGNGFDLHCGLKSQYQDFFNSDLYNGVEVFLKSLEEGYVNLGKPRGLDHIYFSNFNDSFLPQTNLKSFKVEAFAPPESLSKLSFWDLMFFFDKSRFPNEWNQVEDRIKSTLYDTYRCKNFFSRKQRQNEENLISSVFYSFFPRDRWEKYSSYFDFLLAELKRFEMNFSEYIMKEVDNSSDYYLKARKLAETLLQIDGLLSGIQNNIFSFNYTQPFLEEYLKQSDSSIGLLYSYQSNSFINIHGTSNQNDAIFGIDPKGISTHDDKFFFTKTYRQLVTNNIAKYKAMSFDPDNNCVIFFGHSLSQNDYSYFEALFDKLDLYNSSTILIFKFTIYDETRKKEIELDMINRVTKLLESYSSTLDNHDHRDNLLSRMLIERRILISPI